MKILSLSIENHKKIRTFFLDMNGENAIFAGDCGTGKTTAASALWTVMSSGSDLLKHDAKAGKISIKLGNGTDTITAERRFTPKTNTITLTTGSGEPVSIKQFRQMISELSCNPHDIIRKTGKELVDTLLSAADLGGIDIKAVEAKIEALEAERLDASRKLDLLKTGPEPDKVEPVDIAAVAEQKSALLIKASERKAVVDAGKKLWSEQRAIEAEITEIQARMEAASSRLSKARQAVQDKTAEYNAIKGEDYSTDALDGQLQAAAGTNAKAQVYVDWQKSKAKEDKQKAIRSDLDAKVKEQREIKKQALDNAVWPLDGLAIVDGQVMYKDCLLENLGTSEQTLCCAALARNDILKHPLRVCRLDGIEQMSRKDFADLLKLFGDADIQVISTRVARDGAEDGEIVIVDGVYGEQSEEIDPRIEIDSQTPEQPEPIPAAPKCPEEGPDSDDSGPEPDYEHTDVTEENPFG